MSGDTILVRLEAVGQRRFRRDMKVGSRAIAGLTKAHVRASKASKKHGRESKKLTAGLKVLGMVAGRASGPQGVGMLAQALQSATVAASALTAAVGGLAAALGTLERAAAKGFRAVADAAGLAANRLRELAGLLWNAISASAVRGATAALAGMVPVLDRIRAAVRGVAAAFASVGTSMSGKLGSAGEVLRGAGPAVPGLLPATASPANATAVPGGNEPTNRMGLIPPGALPFAALIPAGLGAVHETAIPQFSEGLGDSAQILGDSLGGIYKEIGSAINSVVTELERFGLVTPTILALTAAFGVWKLALFGASVMNTVMAATTGTATIAQEALNRTMRANVIGLIVTALAALVMGVIYAYNKFDWFRNIVDGAWNVLKSIGTWIVENWPLVLGMLVTPIAAAIYLIVTNFNRIKNAVVGALQSIWTWLTENWQLVLAVLITPLSPVIGLIVANFGRIKSAATGALEWVKTAFTNTVNFFKGLPGQIASLGTRMWEGFKSGLNAALEWIVGKVNWFIRQYNKVGGVISKLPGVPNLTIGEISLGDPAPGDPGVSGPVRRAYGGSIPGGPPFNDRVPSLLTPGEHVWTRGEVQAAGGHRAVEELRRNVGRGAGTSSSASQTYVSVEAPVQVKIGEGVLADAMANVHLKVQAGIPT